MKTSLLFAIAFSISLAAQAQAKGTVRLYGYEQDVSGGAAPYTDPQTGIRTAPKGGKNLFLFAVSASRIYPVALWINGEKYGATVKTVGKTPVLYNDPVLLSNPAKVLVPKTGKRVTQLFPLAAVNEKPAGKKAQSQASDHAVVLEYKLGGKSYYTTLKTLTTLDKAAAL